MAIKSDEPPLDVEVVLSDLSPKVERVKVLYEQYFMGIEKIEPLVARKDIQRAMLFLQQQYIRNTGLRFRFNTLLQKWNIYITYWNRTLREIEAGTYTRHIIKAQRAAAREGKQLPEELLRAAKSRPPSGSFDTGLGGRVGKAFLDHDSEAHVVAAVRRDEPSDQFERIPAMARPAPPPIPANAQSKPPDRPARVPGMTEADLRALHQKFLAARRQTGEPAQVSYETLVTSLAKQVPGVLAQPGVQSVRFDVALKDGKAVLKAIPQKK